MTYSSPFEGSIPPPRHEARSTLPVVALGVTRTNLPKGQVVDIVAKRQAGVVVTDTGNYAVTADDAAGPLTPAAIEALYRATIRAGVIDHHVLDNYLVQHGQPTERCATQMIVDFEEEVKKMLQEHQITAVETHASPDLDALCSAFLIQSLLQTGRLPVIAAELSNLVNRVDYGKFPVTPTQFARSLAGQVEAIEAVYDRQARDELNREVFGNPALKDPSTGRLNTLGVQRLTDISNRYATYLNERVFELLNAVNQAKLAHPELDIAHDLSPVQAYLSAPLSAILAEGETAIMAVGEQYEAALQTAQWGNLPTSAGATVDVVFARSADPTLFTNLTYARFPQALAAVYRGAVADGQKASGDHYDIGISPDLVARVNLGPLCVLLNRAEKKKREALWQKSVEQRTSAEQHLVETWDQQSPRLGMSGPEQVLDKDPTVLVANGTLIADSRTSLLSAEDFTAVLQAFGVRFKDTK